MGSQVPDPAASPLSAVRMNEGGISLGNSSGTLGDDNEGLTSEYEIDKKNAVTKQEGLSPTSVRDGACPIGSGLTWMALEVIAYSSLPKAGSRTVSPNAN